MLTHLLCLCLNQFFEILQLHILFFDFCIILLLFSIDEFIFEFNLVFSHVLEIIILKDEDNLTNLRIGSDTSLTKPVIKQVQNGVAQTLDLREVFTDQSVIRNQTCLFVVLLLLLENGIPKVDKGNQKGQKLYCGQKPVLDQFLLLKISQIDQDACALALARRVYRLSLHYSLTKVGLLASLGGIISLLYWSGIYGVPWLVRLSHLCSLLIFVQHHEKVMALVMFLFRIQSFMLIKRQ